MRQEVVAAEEGQHEQVVDDALEGVREGEDHRAELEVEVPPQQRGVQQDVVARRLERDTSPSLDFFPRNTTFSRRMTIAGAWVASASMIRSASSPYTQWRRGSSRSERMCAAILCSPSPGTSAPDSTTRSPAHSWSDCSLWRMKNRSASATRDMNAVPGVMQFESNPPPAAATDVGVASAAGAGSAAGSAAGASAAASAAAASAAASPSAGASGRRLRRLGRRRRLPHGLRLPALARDAVPPLPLLVHLGARRDAVDRNVEQPLRPHELHHRVDRGADRDQLLLLRAALHLGVVAVRARVEDAVRVEVKVVDLGHRQLVDRAVDEWVALREPAVEVGNAHGFCRFASGALSWRHNASHADRSSRLHAAGGAWAARLCGAALLASRARDDWRSCNFHGARAPLTPHLQLAED